MLPALRLHEEASAELRRTPAEAFALLDDHRRLSAHMESASMAMVGASMHVELDERQGRGVGARITMSGRVLGLRLELDEEVVEYDPPRRKGWATLGEPRLLVIGRYRMGFSVEPVGAGSRIRIWIDYELPERRAQRWLGALAGRFYARWCLRQMLRGVQGA